MPDTKLPPDDPAQSQRFIDMAREVRAEGETLTAFDKTLSAVVDLPIQATPAKASSNRSAKTRVSKK